MPMDELGPASAKWDYHDRYGKLIACVYRYDTAEGKEFRPWDVLARAMRAPDPRPMYNQPAIAKADEVVLVEGEKCADALIAQGMVATTAMNGANAPVDKTDWSPLNGKRVIIWPDKDTAGWEYAQKVAAHLSERDVVSVSILVPPEDKAEKWDAFDAVEDGMDINRFVAEQMTQPPSTELAGIHPAKDWIGEPPQREWIVKDWLPKGYVTALYGDGGVGKSLLAQQLMISLATGKPWMDVMLTQRKVYALMCEDDSDELWRRQCAINTAYGLAMEDLFDLKLVSRVGNNNLLMTFDGQDAGKLTPFFDTLLIDIVDFGAEVIILDTAADLFAGNENNRSQVRQFVQNACARIARESKGAVLLCAHPSDSGITRGTGTGGSTAWNNTVRSRWYLSHNFSDEALPNQRILSRKKSNYSASKEDMDLLWSAGTLVRIYPERDDAAVEADKKRDKRDKKSQKKRELILQIIRREALEHGRLYTLYQFGRVFQKHPKLGCERSIKDLIAVMASQGEIVFSQLGEPYGLKNINKGKGYLCELRMPITANVTNKDTGAEEEHKLSVTPTHCIDPTNGELVSYQAPSINHENP
jgi:RecA-family ATPase/5S rRNA maturation endonuclease (ribonuclease M5)